MAKGKLFSVTLSKVNKRGSPGPARWPFCFDFTEYIAKRIEFTQFLGHQEDLRARLGTIF